MSNSSTLSKFEEDFCGGPFWNFSLLWKSENPDFTSCFQKTIFSWVPFAIIFGFSLLELPGYFSSHNKNRNIGLNWYNISKLSLTLCLIVVNFAQIICAGIIEDDEDASTRTIYPADYLFGVVFLGAHVLSLNLLILSLKFGVRASYTEFTFYFVSVICEAAILRSLILKDSSSNSVGKADLILIGCQFGFGILMLFLNFVADRKPNIYYERINYLENECPEISASIPSKLTFSWVTSIIWKGFRNTLDTSMLWALHPGVSSRGVVPIFDSFYTPIIEEAKQKDKLNREAENKESEDIEKTKVSVFPALVKTFGYEFLLGSFFQVISSILIVVGPPNILGSIIEYVENENGDDYAWKVYYFAGLLFATNMVISICNGQYFNKMWVISMKLRTALNSAIYQKALKLSSTARKESTIGEIVNLMSVDVQRFMVSLQII